MVELRTFGVQFRRGQSIISRERKGGRERRGWPIYSRPNLAEGARVWRGEAMRWTARGEAVWEEDCGQRKKMT
jgi:hypothetical protein